MNLSRISRRHPLAYVLAVCTVALACFNAVPAATLGGMVLQAAVAGIAVVALLALADPSAIRLRSAVGKRRVKGGTTCVFLLGIALFAGVTAAAVGPLPAVGAQPLPAGWFGCLLFALLCLFTGVFEEALFRGVLFRGFAVALRRSSSPRPELVAALASSAVFGVLHVSAGASFQSTGFDGVAMLQFAAKPLQALLFGIVMAHLYARTGNLWLAAGTHASFNLLSEGPVFALGAPLATTYVTGNPADLAVLLATVALLVPLAARAVRLLAACEPASPS